jgi:septation ring formation regulator EzrA
VLKTTNIYGDRGSSCGRNIVENPMFEASKRLKFLSYKFFNVATEATTSEECCILIENALDGLRKQVENRKSSAHSNRNEGCDAQVTSEKSKELLSVARLKKKNAQK